MKLFNSVFNLEADDIKIVIFTNNDLLQVSQDIEVDYNTADLTSLIDWAKEQYRNFIP